MLCFKLLAKMCSPVSTEKNMFAIYVVLTVMLYLYHAMVWKSWTFFFLLLLLRKKIWSWNFNFNFFQILVFWGGSPPLPEKRFWKIENKLRFWSDLIIKITTPIIFLIELWPLFLFNYFSVCHLHNSWQKIHTSNPLPVFSNFTLCLICLIMVSTNIANVLLSFCQ